MLVSKQLQRAGIYIRLWNALRRQHLSKYRARTAVSAETLHDAFLQSWQILRGLSFNPGIPQYVFMYVFGVLSVSTCYHYHQLHALSAIQDAEALGIVLVNADSESGLRNSMLNECGHAQLSKLAIQTV